MQKAISIKKSLSICQMIKNIRDGFVNTAKKTYKIFKKIIFYIVATFSYLKSIITSKNRCYIISHPGRCFNPFLDSSLTTRIFHKTGGFKWQIRKLLEEKRYEEIKSSMKNEYKNFDLSFLGRKYLYKNLSFTNAEHKAIFSILMVFSLFDEVKNRFKNIKDKDKDREKLLELLNFSDDFVSGNKLLVSKKTINRILSKKTPDGYSILLYNLYENLNPPPPFLRSLEKFIKEIENLKKEIRDALESFWERKKGIEETIESTRDIQICPESELSKEDIENHCKVLKERGEKLIQDNVDQEIDFTPEDEVLFMYDYAKQVVYNFNKLQERHKDKDLKKVLAEAIRSLKDKKAKCGEICRYFKKNKKVIGGVLLEIIKTAVSSDNVELIYSEGNNESSLVGVYCGKDNVQSKLKDFIKVHGNREVIEYILLATVDCLEKEAERLYKELKEKKDNNKAEKAIKRYLQVYSFLSVLFNIFGKNYTLNGKNCLDKMIIASKRRGEILNFIETS